MYPDISITIIITHENTLSACNGVATSICQKIWSTTEDWTQSLIKTHPKKGNLKKNCKNHLAINLFIHSRRLMLMELLNRIKQKYEEILCKKQAGLRTRRGTSQQIFNIRVLTDSHLQHQCDFYTITL